jgi:hypothetical protein
MNRNLARLGMIGLFEYWGSNLGSQLFIYQIIKRLISCRP